MPIKLIRRILLLTILLPAVADAQQKLPMNDYHEHLLSPAVAKFIGQPKPFLARDLIAQMDAAGIRHAVVLSLAYQFGNPNRPRVGDEYSMVKAENDWTATQVKHYQNRLLGFCGVDPLRDYALSEIDRCSRNPYLKSGLKLHFGNSDVDLDNPKHVEKLRRVFCAADKRACRQLSTVYRQAGSYRSSSLVYDKSPMTHRAHGLRPTSRLSGSNLRFSHSLPI
jgi:predicted TIM-barrel fold metal-dependent hydrolase